MESAILFIASDIIGAREIISIYYDESIASQAEQHFIDVFVNKTAPDEASYLLKILNL